MSHDLLQDFPVVVRLPVQWGDMDAYGHVNNTVFFRYFESARVEYLERCGFLASFERQRVGAILHSTRCRFRRALTHPDTVLVGATAAEVADDRFRHAYRLVSLDGDEIAAEGEGIVVSFDYDRGETVPIPPAVREGIESLQA